MFRFGVTNFTTFFMTFAYIAISVILIFISYNYLAGVDWQRDILFQFVETPINITGF